MESDPHRRPVYEFGEFRLESEHLMLYRGDVETGIPPKAVQTLLALLERQNQIVSKDDLMDSIWADTAVEESNLSRYIHILRTALGDQPSGKPYIETLRRRGYRFTGEVRVIQTLPILEGVHASPEPQPKGSIELFRRRANLPSLSNRSGNVLAVAKWQKSSDLDPEKEAFNEPTTTSAPEPRPRIRPAFAAILAVGLVGVALGAYFLGSASKAPPLTDKDVVLVGDFENLTGEEVFDKTLRQGLSIQLQQSPFLSLFPEGRISETLALMKREGSEKITPELAREICIRQGLKAFITGSISRLGESYVISVSAINPNNSESIASEQVEVTTKEAIIPAISRAAMTMRSRLGESLASIQNLGKPLEATTNSLEALQAYSLGRTELDSGSPMDAQPFLRRAVELDPEFAIAFMYLGQAYFRGGKRDQTDAAILRAYELRDAVSELERLQITDQYHKFISLDNEARIESLTLLKQLYPREPRVRGELADLRAFRGEYEEALDEATTAVEMGNLRSWNTRVQSLVSLGRFEEALAAAEQGIASGTNPTDLLLERSRVRFALGDMEGAEAEIDQVPKEELKPLVTLVRAKMDVFRGRFNNARKVVETSIEHARRIDVKERLAQTFAEAGLLFGLAGDCPTGLTFAATALETDEYPPIPGAVANTYAWCGDKEKAMTIMGRLAKRSPNGTLQTRQITPLITAAGALKSRDFGKVLENLNSIPAGFERKSSFKVQFLRGRALAELGRNEEAIEAFRNIIENRNESLLSPLYLFAHLEAARAYARMGDAASAKSYYEKFLEFWKDADSDLPALIEARREFRKLNEDS